MNKKSDILYLFDRPAEPVYVPKGENKVAFNVPADYLVSTIPLDASTLDFATRFGASACRHARHARNPALLRYALISFSFFFFSLS